ncbi:GCN5-related N-acetyltransferase [Novosphingobium nitrogenifigens DSM 19370]|uniref:GCN5-related N-acetyltransferase n=1 Tax=Novosphingobium nitrogenifigens DSM 19370 TaxID=983920 RepID=F1Z861_9SPHN|nr:GNAT family N-acetyltransferase [Novosphingobium nitrogenifigens]EGD59164.1 GCN5-related N-acetyltransferase [Novosphingobium nitrogenifigens DSM 19370]
MSAASFRPATPADVPALRVLVERAYRGDSARGGWTHEADLLDDERTSDTTLEQTIVDPATRVVLAERDGALLGTVTVQDLGDGRAYLGMLCVDPALQAGGIGRALIEAAEQAARREFGASIMEMTVIDRRTELLAWYERRGYVRTGETRPFPVPGDFPFAMIVLERAIA